MNPEHKQELNDEEREEERLTEYTEWLSDNQEQTQENFLQGYNHRELLEFITDNEEVMSEFISIHEGSYEEYCEETFNYYKEVTEK